MIAPLLLVVSGSLLDSKSWNPSGRKGKTAEPDYKTIVGMLTESVQFEDLISAPRDAVQKAEGGLRVMRGAFKTAPNYMTHAASVLAAASSDQLASLGGGLVEASLPAAEKVVRKAEGGLRVMRGAFNSAPDYAQITSRMLTSFTSTSDNEAEDEDEDEFSVGFDCFGFALPVPDSLVRTAGNALRQA